MSKKVHLKQTSIFSSYFWDFCSLTSWIYIHKRWESMLNFCHQIVYSSLLSAIKSDTELIHWHQVESLPPSCLFHAVDGVSWLVVLFVHNFHLESTWCHPGVNIFRPCYKWDQVGVNWVNLVYLVFQTQGCYEKVFLRKKNQMPSKRLPFLMFDLIDHFKSVLKKSTNFLKIDRWNILH